VFFGLDELDEFNDSVDGGEETSREGKRGEGGD
jgi:hypothetical protein